MEFSKHNWAMISENLPQNSHFWQVGPDIVLSEYPDKSHNFRNFIFYDVTLSVLYFSGILA